MLTQPYYLGYSIVALMGFTYALKDLKPQVATCYKADLADQAIAHAAVHTPPS